MTLSELEDALDLQAYEEAMKAFEKDPTTYSLSEVEKELGLTEIFLEEFEKEKN